MLHEQLFHLLALINRTLPFFFSESLHVLKLLLKREAFSAIDLESCDLISIRLLQPSGCTLGYLEVHSLSIHIINSKINKHVFRIFCVVYCTTLSMFQRLRIRFNFYIKPHLSTMIRQPIVYLAL